MTEPIFLLKTNHWSYGACLISGSNPQLKRVFLQLARLVLTSLDQDLANVCSFVPNPAVEKPVQLPAYSKQISYAEECA